jgi:hypothetical protein
MMNKKVTDIHREDLEEMFEVKMSDEQWCFFTNTLHEKIVPNLFEEITIKNN